MTLTTVGYAQQYLKQKAERPAVRESAYVPVDAWTRPNDSAVSSSEGE